MPLLNHTVIIHIYFFNNSRNLCTYGYLGNWLNSTCCSNHGGNIFFFCCNCFSFYNDSVIAIYKAVSYYCQKGDCLLHQGIYEMEQYFILDGVLVNSCLVPVLQAELYDDVAGALSRGALRADQARVIVDAVDGLPSDVEAWVPASATAFLLEQAVNTAIAQRGVSVLTIPGDIGGADMPNNGVPNFVDVQLPCRPHPQALRAAAQLLNEAVKVTMLVGMGARGAKDDLLAVAKKLAAPMVLTLKAKEGLEDKNPYQVGQSGLIGNPGAQQALDDCEVLLMVGTDFPYRDSYPAGKIVIQIERDGGVIGRRTAVSLGVVGDSKLTLAALEPLLESHTDTSHIVATHARYQAWTQRHLKLANPDYNSSVAGRVRTLVDNPGALIRPESLAAAVDRHAPDDAIFTSDTGMCTVWLARYVTMRGTRRLLGSFNLGSMANAMPQALGASALDRSRPVVAFCGDGGLTMLMGDLLTAVAYSLPVKLVVFNNGRLGMVKLEQEQGGLPEFGTILHNPDLAEVARACGMHGIRVEDADVLDGAVQEALNHPGPVLLDVVTNPNEVSVPPKTTAGQAWGFAIAKIKEGLTSRGDS